MNQFHGSLEHTPGSFREVNSLLAWQRQSLHKPTGMLEPNDYRQGTIFVHANLDVMAR
jgi:hypothetical protein